MAFDRRKAKFRRVLFPVFYVGLVLTVWLTAIGLATIFLLLLTGHFPVLERLLFKLMGWL
jgi:hypothetical protein